MDKDQLISPLTQGSILKEYQVERTLGQGGFGTTYLCVDLNLQRKCVIKEFSPHHLARRSKDGHLKPKSWQTKRAYKKGLQCFLTEAQRLGRFNHPHIVRIARYFEYNRTAYFVMDYESGISLRSIMSEKAHQFEELEIESIILPLCEGLDKLHSNGLIHRDIKPDNILIRPKGDPVLIDFGAAVDLDEKDIQIIYTPNYAPIEQYDSRFPQGPWVDIYAIGATVYELISGAPPPRAIERLEIDTLKPARDVGRGKYGDRLLGLVDKSLAIDPTERPQDIHEFLSLLHIDNDRYFREIIGGLSEKTIQHFLNWATPNQGLYVDEFVAFSICFPIVDFSWRVGKGNPTKELFLSLYRSLDQDTLDRCHDRILGAGFSNHKRKLTLKTILSRVDEYSATYLLDRQAKEWTYDHTRRQCATNCLSDSAQGDTDGFMGLMEQVIDRCRGRVKKEYNKAFRKVNWIHTPTGWRKQISSFSG